MNNSKFRTIARVGVGLMEKLAEGGLEREAIWHLLVNGGASGKEPACQCRRLRDAGSTPESGRSPGGGHGYPLQYSCLENPMGRESQGAWRAAVHRVAIEATEYTHIRTIC